MPVFQSASAVHIEHSTLNSTRDQTNIGGDLIIHNSNNGTSQTTPTPFIIVVRAYVSFRIDQPLCSTS
jgi:hypothetical protein